MAAHAKLSPSAAHRWMHCPGAPALCATVPKRTSGYADEGSAAHALAQHCLERGHNAIKYLGWYAGQNARRVGYLRAEHHPEVEGVTQFLVTAEMVDAVQLYLDVVRGLENEYGGKAHVEKKVDLGFLAPDTFGTADAAILAPFDAVVVVDLKYGAGVAVEADDNAQLRIYAIGMMGGADNPDGVGVARTIIVQPRAHHHQGPVREECLPIGALLRWAEDDLMPAVKGALDPKAVRVPGKWCRWCDGENVCPEKRGEMFAAVPTAELDAAGIPSLGILPSPGQMTVEQLAKVKAITPMLEDWIGACNTEALVRAQRGVSIPGFKLVAGRATRKWLDEKKAEAALSTYKQLIYEVKLKSPAQMEKLVKSAGHDPNVVLAPLVEVNRGTTLAPEDDKRPALNTAEQMFG